MTSHPAPALPEELKECPFCGGEAAFGVWDHDANASQFGGEYVQCTKCAVSTALVFPCKDDVKRELTERWNRRASEMPSYGIELCDGVIVPDGLASETAKLVIGFASALATKLYNAQQKYGYWDGWTSPDWMSDCRAELRKHVEKGDPRDVAAYCAFLWYHHESTSLAAAKDKPTSSPGEEKTHG